MANNKKDEIKVYPPHDIRLSVSKTKSYLACAAQYKFTYILKIPKAEVEKDYLIFGTYLHEILETFHRYYLEGGQDSYNVVMGRSFKDAAKQYSLKLSSELRKEARSIIDSYLRAVSEKTQPWTHGKVTGVEKDFSIVINDRVLLNGFIDRLQVDPDGVLHVSDYKSSKSDKYLKNDPFQLLTYAYVLCREDPTLMKVRASYIMLRDNFKWLTKEFDREEIMKMEKVYLDYADQILSDKLYRANPNFLCRYCDYLEICGPGLAFAKPNSVFGETKW